MVNTGVRTGRTDSAGFYLFDDQASLSTQASTRSPTRSPQKNKPRSIRERSSSSPLEITVASRHEGRKRAATDVLEFLQPGPQHPPQYTSLPPGGCPHYPVFPNPCEGAEALPSYSPTVYKLAVLPRKLEWISPYEPAPIRHWKDVIVELNSTQLNIYSLEPKVDIQQTVSCSEFKNNRKYRAYNSDFTAEGDLQNLISFKQSHLIGTSTLMKSYSLQYGKLGVAMDYKKKKHTLRLRVETEQFLLQFNGIQEMVDWYYSLALGIDNSLDLASREMPRYRTVPRRRRLRHNSDTELLLRRHRHYTPQEVANMFRARRGSAPELRLGVRSTFSLLKSKLTSNSNSSSKRPSSESLSSLAEYEPSPSPPETDEIVTSLDMLIINDEDESEDELDDLDDSRRQSLDDDYSSIVDLETEPVTVPTNTSSCSSPSSTNTTTFDYVSRASSETSTSSNSEKWMPDYDDLPSAKKMLRDAMRCMQVMMANERWSGKKLVKDYTNLMSRREASTPTAYHHAEFRPLQEFVVSPQGLVPAQR